MLSFLASLLGGLRKAVSLNSAVLAHAAEQWVAVFDFQGEVKTPPLNLIQHQASYLKLSQS